MTRSEALSNLRGFAEAAADSSSKATEIFAAVLDPGSLAERVARFLRVANSDSGPDPFVFAGERDGGWGGFFSAVGVVSGLTPDGDAPSRSDESDPALPPLVFLDGSALASLEEEADGTMVVLSKAGAATRLEAATDGAVWEGDLRALGVVAWSEGSAVFSDGSTAEGSVAGSTEGTFDLASFLSLAEAVALGAGEVLDGEALGRLVDDLSLDPSGWEPAAFAEAVVRLPEARRTLGLD